MRLSVIGILLSLILFLGCSKFSNDSIVAKVGNQKMTAEEFKESYTKSNTYATYRWKKYEPVYKYLNDTLIMDLYILHHADDIHIENDFLYQLTMENFLQKKLLDNSGPLIQRKVISKASVSEDEIRDFYKKLENKYRFAQIVLREKTIADSVYQLLNSGADFGEMVRKFSQDKQSIARNGEVGLFSWANSKIPEDFKNKVFALEEGEVSQPIEMSHFFFIVKMIEVVKNDELKPFEQEKALLERKLKMVKMNELTLEYIDQLKEEANVQYNQEFLSKIDEKIRKDSSFKLDLARKEMFKSDEFDQVLVSYFDKEITFKQFFKMCEIKYPMAQQLFDSSIGLTDYIDRRILVQELMLYDAQRMGLDQEKDFQERYKNSIAKTKIGFMTDKFVKDSIEFTDELKKEFYEENVGILYTKRAQLIARIIVMDDQETADKVYRELKRGADYNEMVKKYSVERYSKTRNGFVGNVLYEDDYKFLAEPMKDLEKDEYTKPFKHENHYYIAMCRSNEPGKVLNYEDVINGPLEFELGNRLYKKYQENYHQELREKYDHKIFEENLKKLFEENRTPIITQQ